MGLIKYRGEVIYSGPLAEVEFDKNWCDSMAEYYPRMWVKWLDMGELKSKQVEVPMSTADDWYSKSEIVLDEGMARELADSRERRRKEEEHKKLDYHKLVRVVRGRKLPIGTEGEIFWMGNTKFGPSIGLRLIDGEKVFTSPRNVEVISLDELFERDLFSNSGPETKN